MAQSLSCVRVLATLGLQPTGSSVEFSGRQECWRGLLFPLPGDLPDPGIELAFPESPALAGGFLTTAPPGKQEHDEPTIKQRLLLVGIIVLRDSQMRFEESWGNL